MATATAKRPAKPAPKTNSKPLAASVKAPKIIYFFGKSKCDGKGGHGEVAKLGGKGANLAEMTRIGLPVPPGFTITTEVCTYYYDNGKKFPPNQASDLAKAIAVDGKRDRQEVRRSEESAARFWCVPARAIRMPGMMDTILNLGLNDADDRGPHGRDEQRPLRLGFVSPLCADVRRCRDGRAKAARERA